MRFACLLGTSLLIAAPLTAQSSRDAQVAAAVLAAPADRQAGARVLGYDEAGKLTVLREGSNDMICLADNPAIPTFHVACYHESLEPCMARGRSARAEGVPEQQVDSVRFREIAAGKLTMPAQPAALWQLSGPAGSWNPATNEVTGARPPLYVVYIPFATEASTGLPAKPAPGLPWIMFPGTPKAHIMFVPGM